MKITFSENELINFYKSADAFLHDFIKTIGNLMDEYNYDYIHQLLEDYNEFDWYDEIEKIENIFRQFGIEIEGDEE